MPFFSGEFDQFAQSIFTNEEDNRREGGRHNNLIIKKWHDI